MPSISVIIAAYIDTADKERWLNEAIISVVKADFGKVGGTFQDVEIIVVDDASPWDLIRTVRCWAGARQIRWLRLDSHSGPSAARNAGAARATADWLFVLDADDHVKHHGLRALYDARKDGKFIYGDVQFIGDRAEVKRLDDWNLTDLWRARGPIGVSALQPRSLWQLLGGWREDLAGLEDIEYWMRAAEAGITGKHIPTVTFEYRIHAGSRTRQFERAGQAQQLATQVRDMHRAFFEGRR